MNVPPPALCENVPMAQLADHSLSPPRGPACCVSTMNASPMNIMCHDPVMVISIGICHDRGFMLVPDDSSIRYIPELAGACPRHSTAPSSIAASTPRPG